MKVIAPDQSDSLLTTLLLRVAKVARKSMPDAVEYNTFRMRRARLHDQTRANRSAVRFVGSLPDNDAGSED